MASDDADPLAHRGLPDMRLVGRSARAQAAAVLPLLPAAAEVTLEALACGGRSRWHRGHLTGAMTWRAPSFDVASGLFVPCVITCDRQTGELTRVEGPKGFETWQEAEEAGRFLRQVEGRGK